MASHVATRQPVVGNSGGQHLIAALADLNTRFAGRFKRPITSTSSWRRVRLRAGLLDRAALEGGDVTAAVEAYVRELEAACREAAS
jgi:hypothetical protein